MFTLKEVVPWGRSFEEYVRMFDLTREDLGVKILGCGDGPAGFNSRMNKLGNRVISADPLYQFTAAEIKARIDDTYDKVMEQTRQNPDNFVWTSIGSVEELGQTRMAAMKEFLQDYEAGRLAGRYIAAGVPELPFHKYQFDLALCSHFLFLYTRQLSLEFHRTAIRELCRVAREVRIFPLVNMDCQFSAHIPLLQEEFARTGRRVEIRKVPYEFQRGGNQMMRLIE